MAYGMAAIPMIEGELLDHSPAACHLKTEFLVGLQLCSS